MRMQFRLSAALATVGLLICAPSRAAIMYATDDNTDELYVIDVTTGQGTLVGTTVEDISFTGLAWDASTGTMYVSDVADPECAELTSAANANLAPEAPQGSCWGLGTVDLATGAVTFIGSHVLSSDIQGLAWDSTNDVLYGSDTDNGSLDVIDRSTGEATIVGSFNLEEAIRALAYDRSSDTLFGASYTSLYSINRATGVATLVGSFGLPVPEFHARGLEVDPDTGILYLGTVDDSSFYSVNKSTGAATLIGVSNVQIFGLAAVPTGANVTAIPTLDLVGLSALALALAAFATWRIMRRRAA